MRALLVHSVPATPTVDDVPLPQAGAGELLVRIEASSVNGFDAATAAGYVQGMMEHRFPLVLGKDFAGTVEAVGEGVTEFAVGDPVFGVVAKPFLGAGSLAEYVVVPAASGIARIPDGVSATDAGALGLAGAAALDSLAAVEPAEGETFLVVGATGGVGAIAIQYAAARGVRIIATALPGAHADFVRSLGADIHVVDYTADLAVQLKDVAPSGVDVALHLAGDGQAVAELVRPGGRIASTLGFGPDAVAGRDLTVVAVMADTNAATLERLAADVAAGRLRVPVTTTYPLEQAPQAFADFGAGALGKLGITLV
ncbi:NADP-dependent oxidoreductase [Kribbella sp. NBC_00889]|uniref:NADP-dependent oxidoreductase n=1 Tax=Kribbella sp. NBC_00889 TaxID=2975974 RepID=UPI00386F2AF6|nr:NADP-dependent oxidoreductase [Kribbella sp. NBC_00889]